MTTLIARVLAATTLIMAALIAPVSTATASPVCSIGRICGHIKLASSSNYNLPVTCDWNNQAAARQVLAPGQSDSCHDMDGIFLASGFDLYCRATSGDAPYSRTFSASGWNKTNDAFDKVCQVRRD